MTDTHPILDTSDLLDMFATAVVLKPRGERVAARQATTTQRLTTAEGDTLHAREGDWIVNTSTRPDDKWVVNRFRFAETYEPDDLRAGWYVKTMPVLAAVVERACTVATEEGHVTADPGDALLMNLGGDVWPSSSQKVAEKYEPDGRLWVPSWPIIERLADREADQRKRRYQRWAITQLAALFAAAVLPLLPFTRVAGVATAAMFLLAIVGRTAARKPFEEWTAARTKSETIKTLLWRYGNGATPYDRDDADERIREALENGRTMIGLDVAVSVSLPLSWALHHRRPRHEKVRVYIDRRVRDQLIWFQARSDDHRKRAAAASRLSLFLEVAGIVLALLFGFSVISVDVSGVLAAGAASFAAYMLLQRYARNADAYQETAQQLRVMLDTHTQYDDSDQHWATFAERVEETISDEHSGWAVSLSTAAEVALP